jgi:amidase
MQVGNRTLRKAHERETGHAQRINAIFDDVDLLVTPATGTLPVEVGKWRGKSAIRTLLGMSRVYAFTATWNYTGQPAMAVPVGISSKGLPLAAMLIAPPGREDLLLAVAHQMEQALDWPSRRPPVD